METLKFYEGGYNPEKEYVLYKSLEDGKFKLEYYRVLTTTSSTNHTHANKDVLDKITDEKILYWDGKSEFDGDYESLINKPNIPSKTSDLTNDSDFVTTTEMNTAIANAQIGSGTEIDTSNFATKDDLKTKADKSELHSHSNKPVLDTITNEKVAEWDSKSDFSGDYNDLTNKPALHSHSNKNTLDTITEEKLAEWDNKSSFSGNYNDLTNKPTIPKVDSVLSSTSTNAIQNKVVKSALDSKANISHIHSISDVTNLQDSLDSKSDATHTHSYNDLSDKPTIPTMPTIDSALSSTSTNSVQNKVVTNALNNKSDKGHTHSYDDLTNKPTIPTVTNDLTNELKNKYDTAYTHSQSAHAPSNAEKNVQSDWNVIDTTSDAYIKNKPSIHSHTNKTVLDGITADKVVSWDNKSEFSGSYNDLVDKPTIPTKTSQLTNDSNFVTTSTLNTELNKKANASHDHAISDITNLQTTLDGKSDTSHTHNYAGSSTEGGDATNALACSGNSATASKLQTARLINGTSFDGNADITTSRWGTARNITIGNTTKTIDGSSNVSWTLREIGIYDSVVKIVTNVQELESAMAQGGVIYVLEGTYQLGQDISLEYVSNTHLIALGDVTISINTNSSNYIAMRPKLNGTEGGYTAIENFNMSGITFDGKGATNKAGLFATAHSKNVHIEGCTFKNLNNSWHLVEVNSSDTVVFDRCTFSDYNYRDIVEGDYFTEAVQLDYAGTDGNYPFTCNLDNTGCKNVTFNNCTFTRVKTTWTACLGSHLYNSENGRHENIALNNCIFDDIDNGIYAMGWKNLSINNTVFNNIATAIIIAPQADNDGTSLSVIGCRYNGKNRFKIISQFNNIEEGRFIMNHNHSYRLSSSNISNNFIENAYSHGIGISPVDTTITGNSLRYCGKHGIYLYGGQQTTVNSNTSVGCGTLSWYTGRDIYISVGALGYVKRCIIANNAAYVYTDGNTYEGTKIQDNL